MMRYIVRAHAGGERLLIGTFEASSPSHALEKARKEFEEWAAEELDVDPEDLIFEVEEEFL
jgi:hypothetical protein